MIPGAFQNGFQNQRVFKVDSIPCKPPEGHLKIVAQVNDNNPVFQTVRSGIRSSGPMSLPGSTVCTCISVSFRLWSRLRGWPITSATTRPVPIPRAFSMLR